MYGDFYSPFDFFGGVPTRQQRRREYDNPFFGGFSDPFNDPRMMYPHQSRKYSQQPQRPKRVNNRSPPPEMEEKERPISPKTMKLINNSVTTIQKAYRSYQVQKMKIIPNLRILKEVEQNVERAHEKFSNILRSNPDLAGEKLRMTYAEYEETLTRALLRLDGVITRGCDLVRERRKELVSHINSELSKVDAKKPEIRKSVEKERAEKEQERLEQERLEQEKLEQERLELERLEQEELEQNLEQEISDSESESDFENVEMRDSDEKEDWVMVDETEEMNDSSDHEFDITEELRLLEEEDAKLAEEKIKLEELMHDWQMRKNSIENKRQALLSNN